MPEIYNSWYQIKLFSERNSMKGVLHIPERNSSKNNWFEFRRFSWNATMKIKCKALNLSCGVGKIKKMYRTKSVTKRSVMSIPLRLRNWPDWIGRSRAVGGGWWEEERRNRSNGLCNPTHFVACQAYLTRDQPVQDEGLGCRGSNADQIRVWLVGLVIFFYP